eukprot:jgi/Ulvmu1/7815/UM004_0044.1
MWSRAAILDSACLDKIANEERHRKRQIHPKPTITINVTWDHFASIAVWDQDSSQACVDLELQLTDADLVKSQNAHASTSDKIRDVCNDAKSGFVMIARADHAVLMCLKTDVRSYFKAIATVHKTRPFAKVPDVKRDVALAAKVLKQDIAAMFLQLHVDELLKAGWLTRPSDSGGISLVKHDGDGSIPNPQIVKGTSRLDHRIPLSCRPW